MCVKRYNINLKVNFNSVESICKFISIYQVLGLPKDMQLSRKELVYYSNIVYLWNKKLSLSDEDLLHNLPKIDGISKNNRGIYIYRSKLLKKNWLVKGKSGFDIPNILKNNRSDTELILTIKNETI